MKQIILSSTKTYDIILEPISSTMMNIVDTGRKEGLFKNDDDNRIIKNTDTNEELPCPISHIYCIGTALDISESQLVKFIPSKYGQGQNFMCYAKNDFSSPNPVLHDSATSAYYCALEILGKPKYAIIYRKSKIVLENYNQGIDVAN